MLVMYTFVRSKPTAAKILSNNCPLCPTKGIPWRSSSAPGASPNKRISACSFPTPKTIFKAQSFIEISTFLIASFNSASVFMLCFAARCTVLISTDISDTPASENHFKTSITSLLVLFFLSFSFSTKFINSLFC